VTSSNVGNAKIKIEERDIISEVENAKNERHRLIQFQTELVEQEAQWKVAYESRHHRVLHVRQEVPHVPKTSPASSDGNGDGNDDNCFTPTPETDEMSVLQSVIKSDVE